jgi:metal-dependent amidase/aminoacylase/carboxypeptidase family protein
VQTGIAKTGLVGILRGGKPGPVVALRADIDALPVKERLAIPFASKVVGEYNGREYLLCMLVDMILILLC